MFRIIIPFLFVALLSDPLVGTAYSAENEAGSRVGMLSLDVLRAQLQAAGYSNFGEIKLHDSIYRVEAEKNGQRLVLDVDAMTGRITNE